MDVRSITGTHDILPGSVELWQRIEEAVHRIFQLYGFAEIRTPILEETELFARSIGGATDLVQKEMFTFELGKGKSVTLRPEGTAPVVRAYVENSLHASGRTDKLYYIGPMFRRERPQKGRYRQFHQVGAEVLGTDNPAVEAEVIEMLTHLLADLGLEDYRLLVNSVGCRNCRPAYVELLRREIDRNLESFCGQCRVRNQSNPLRVFDCKVESCGPWIAQLPPITDHLCDECRRHFAGFLGVLDQLEIPYRQDPKLVRGLDYYVRTTFEIISDRLGPTQNALLGGGRYDGLSEILGGPEAKGFGFAMGLERFVLLLSGRDHIQGEYQQPAPQVFLAYMDSEAFDFAFQVARDLRRGGISAYLDFEARSLKAQLRLANKLQAEFSCVVGSREVETGELTLKRMSDGKQTKVTRSALPGQIREFQTDS